MDAALEEYLLRRRQPVALDEDEVEAADPGDMDRSLSPEPLALRERPRFDSLMAGLDAPRLQAEADVELERGAADDLADMAGRRMGRDGVPLAAVAGARTPLPMGRGAPADEGSAGPMGYLDALRRAQRMDDLTAAVGRGDAAMQQLAQITSRGVFQPQPLPPMPSEVGKELQRRAAVAEYLKQKRDEESAATDAAYKRALTGAAEALKTQRLTPAAAKVDPLLEDRRAKLKAATDADKALAERRRRASSPASTKPTRDYVGERTAEYERRLKEGIPAGWELQPGAAPTQKQREDAAKIVVSKSMVDESIGAIRNLLAQPGAVANPATRDLLAQQGQFVQTQLRVLEDLGVPSGPDAKILGTLIGDPESLKGEVLDTTQRKLDALGKYVGNRVNATTSTYGLRRKEKAPADAAKASPSDVVRVRRKRDGVVVEVSAAMADALVEAEKAERVP